MKRHKEIMMSEAVETNPIEDLINHSLNQDYNKANEIFGSVVGQKLDDALEQEKIRMADQIYNSIDPEEEDDDEESDDQLEFDLESEDDEDFDEDEAIDDSEAGGIDGGTEDDAEEEEL